MSSSLVLESIRKARNAIYYSLGEPAFIEILLREEAENSDSSNDSVLRFLVELESAVQQLGHLEEFNNDTIMTQADNLVHIATDIVETFTGEKIE